LDDLLTKFYINNLNNQLTKFYIKLDKILRDYSLTK